MSEDIEQKVCKSPFYLAEISENGEVFPCCPRYINFYSFGNIFENTLEEIWNSDKANYFRNKILNNDYSLCDRSICVYNQFIDKNSIDNSYYKSPKYLRLAYDYGCNVACKTCRNQLRSGDKEKNKVIFNNIKDVLANVEEIQLMLCGDVFASEHGKNLILYISNNHPNIKINIDTNGILLNKNLFEKLDLQGKIGCLNISIPGATKKTYEQIVVNGNFDKVMENLDFLTKQDIQKISIIMVIHALNYKEMPLMAEITKKYNINLVYTCFMPWEYAPFSKDYDKLAIFSAYHKNHKKFLKVLSNPNIVLPHCTLENKLIDMRNQYIQNKFSLKKFVSKFYQ